MALSYINNKEIKFGSVKPLNGVYTPGSPTREYEPLDSLGIYLNSGIPLSYGVENNRYMSMSDEFVATSQGNSYSFNQFFAAQMMLGFKLHDRFIACDTEHKIIGTEPLLHKAYLAEITEKTLDYFKIKIYEEKTRTFCIRMSSSEVPTSYVDLTNSFDENGLNLTQTDRQSFLSYYRFYPLTARDPSSRAEETLGVDYYLLPSAEGLKELSGDILSKFNAFISSDGTLTSLGNTAFAYAGDIDYVPNYRSETSEAAVSAAESARVILGQVEEMHADINQILPEMKENLELTKQYRDEAMSTEIGTVRTDLDAEINARIEADTALSTKIEVASSVNRYEIENLKAKAEGKLYRTETVEAETYTVDVPSSVAPYAEVQKIGGKSVVWNQLANKSRYATTIYNGISRTAVGNSLKIEGTPTSPLFNVLLINNMKIGGHKILFIPNIVSSNGNKPIFYHIAPESDTNNATTLSETGNSFYIADAVVDSNYLLVELSIGAAYSFTITPQIFDLTLMFGAGNEPTLEECEKIFSADYYPYDAGSLKSFPVKRVKSVGKNLLNSTLKTYTNNGITCRNNGDGTYTLNGTANNNTVFNLGKIGSVNNVKMVGCPEWTPGYYLVFLKNNSWSEIVTESGNGSSVFSSDYNQNTVGVAINKGVTISNKLIKPMITKDTNATYDSFVPYMESTLDLSSVTSDLKSAGSVHDEWSNGKVTKRTKTVDISNLSFSRDGDKYWYTAGIPIGLGLVVKCISNKLSYGGYSSGETPDRTKWYLSGAGYFELYDDTATSQQELKNNYAGTIIQFELVTPTEETVPEIDNYINVGGGGTLTFESDETVKMPVPSTTRFVVDLASTTEETT